MTRTIRAEFVKLRTALLPFGLLAVAAVLTLLITLLKASRAGSTNGHVELRPLYTAAGLRAVITSTDFSMLLAMVFGVTVSSGEFRHQTATATYLTNPNRVQVLAAKAIAAACFGLLFGVVGSMIATTVGLSFAAAHGYAIAIAGGTIARYAIGASLGCGLLALLGVGVGSLIRSQLGATIAVLAWGFVIERVVGGVFSSVAPYLPYTAATSIAGTPLGSGTTALPLLAAAALISATAACASAIAARTTLPADIT
jgi:ABC-2 type transport system permease protein